MSVTRLRRAARAAGLHPVPQRQARAAAATISRRSRTPTAASALAALTGELAFTAAKPALIRDLVAARIDPVLFALVLRLCRRSRRDGGADLAAARAGRERAAAGARRGGRGAGGDAEGRAAGADRAAGSTRSDAIGRLGALKLITGGLRVGVSARLAKIALAEIGGPVGPDEIEEVWHGLAPPYLPLFAWLEGKRGRNPIRRDAPVFRPLMLAHPLEDADIAALDPRRPARRMEMGRHPRPARRRAAAAAGSIRAAATTSPAPSPRSSRRWTSDAVLDGELLVIRDGAVGAVRRSAAAAEPQGRDARRCMREFPVGVRLYDLLFEATRGSAPAALRRAPRPAGGVGRARIAPARMDLSPLIAFAVRRRTVRGARTARAPPRSRG